MPYWVHGRDAATGEARDSLFIETENEADARQQAAEEGMTVEEVHYVTPREDPPKPASPSEPLRCVRCDSSRVVPRAAIWDSDSQSGGHPLQAYVNAKPHAIIFRGAAYATLYARVCAGCGHAEIFADGAE